MSTASVHYSINILHYTYVVTKSSEDPLWLVNLKSELETSWEKDVGVVSCLSNCGYVYDHAC